MKAKSGCWTCKQRKIRCDKAIPHCDNCGRAGRTCQGYGVRLTWPDSSKGRQLRLNGRALKSPTLGTEYQDEGWYKRLSFLNFTFEDISLARCARVYQPWVETRLPKPTPALTLHSMAGKDALLLTYYKSRIATMISTVHSRNGFCQDLLPMAMANPDPAASALRNAMLAVAAYHLHGSASALLFKTRAIGRLSRALEASSETTETQMAASMMLCVYSVFDESEGNWNVHLDGAKRMFLKQKRLDTDFIWTWFLYHEVLGCFTRPARLAEGHSDTVDFLQASTCNTGIIIGSLGCSLETMVLMHEINKLRLKYPTTHDKPSSAHAAKERLIIDVQLRNLTQTLPPSETHNQTRTLAIAELYRLAAMLYLQRTCPMPEDSPRRSLCLQQAFSCLNALEVATSPWPVFVVACESAPSDEHRVRMLGVLDRMDEVRGIGNVRVMRRLVESFWKQFDLGRVAEGGWASWWDGGDAAVAEPWFI